MHLMVACYMSSHLTTVTWHELYHNESITYVNNKRWWVAFSPNIAFFNDFVVYSKQKKEINQTSSGFLSVRMSGFLSLLCKKWVSILFYSTICNNNIATVYLIFYCSKKKGSLRVQIITIWLIWDEFISEHSSRFQRWCQQNPGRWICWQSKVNGFSQSPHLYPPTQSGSGRSLRTDAAPLWMCRALTFLCSESRTLTGRGKEFQWDFIQPAFLSWNSDMSTSLLQPCEFFETQRDSAHCTVQPDAAGKSFAFFAWWIQTEWPFTGTR